jgi:hypothetical protein
VVFAAYSTVTLLPVCVGLALGLALAIASYAVMPPRPVAVLLESIRSMCVSAWVLSIIFVALAIVSV